jgi:signal peptidase I
MEKACPVIQMAETPWARRVKMESGMHLLKDISGTKSTFMIPFEGFSMYPFFRPRDRLIVRRSPCKPVKVGDIILFRPDSTGSPNSLIAHRVIGRTGNSEILTKGDNLPRPDPKLVDQDHVLGQVIYVVRRGRMIPLTGGVHGFGAKWVALLSRKNLTPGILWAKVKDLMGIKR